MLALHKKKPPSMATVHLFAQIASLIDRDIVKNAVKKYHTDKYSQNLATWPHLIALMFCQFADCNSLRDIEHGMAGICRQLNHPGISKAPSRNALSHQNRKRCPEVFRSIYMALRNKLLGQHRFECRFKGNIKASRVKLLDSSTITLCLKYFDRAHYSEEKGVIKLHTLFSLNDFLPVDIHISDGKETDNIGAYHVMPGAGSIIVADRGYDDSCLWRDWDSMGTTFVVRLRKDIKFERLEEFLLPDDTAQHILVDEAILLTEDETSVQYPRPLRRIPLRHVSQETVSGNGSTGACRACGGACHQQLQVGCGNHQRALSGALAHRNLSQAYQTESAHQDLCRYQQECGTHADMDSHDSHFTATVSSCPHPLQLAHVQLGDIYPHSFDEPYRLMDLVKSNRNERGITAVNIG